MTKRTLASCRCRRGTSCAESHSFAPCPLAPRQASQRYHPNSSNRFDTLKMSLPPAAKLNDYSRPRDWVPLMSGKIVTKYTDPCAHAAKASMKCLEDNQVRDHCTPSETPFFDGVDSAC